MSDKHSNPSTQALRPRAPKIQAKTWSKTWPQPWSQVRPGVRQPRIQPPSALQSRIRQFRAQQLKVQQSQKTDNLQATQHLQYPHRTRFFQFQQRFRRRVAICLAAVLATWLTTASLFLTISESPAWAASTVSSAADSTEANNSWIAIPASSTANSTATSGSWQAPVDEIVVARAFDPPAQPWLSGHRGVDLDMPVGTEICAAGSGAVIFAGQLVDRPVISIQHSSGLRTTYEPVEPIVSKGDTVVAGQVIGTVVSGHSPGTLHWGARIDQDTYINPLQLIAGLPYLKPWE